MQSVPPALARSVLDAAPDAMIVIDESGVIRFANRQATTVFGYAHVELVGQKVEFLMPPRFQARHLSHRQSYAESLRMRPMGIGLELFGLRKDGTEFPVEISLSPIDDDSGTLVAAAIRDVTDRKRVEAELIVARQNADVARESADRANQGKSRFLATASHDLRQPLQTLSLLNGMLRRAIAEPVAAEALVQQELAIGSMSRLLNALLDISKLESGAIKPDPIDFSVSGLFEELRLEFAGLASSRGLTLKVSGSDDYAHSDRALVEQILMNLLSNAIKYTRAGWISLRCVLDASSLLRIEVEDTGIGIPADQLRLIYDEFYQIGVPTNSSREGYGLGLSIVQRLVTLLSAKLEVRSEVGKGSVFSLTLPAGHAVKQQRKIDDRGSTQGHKGAVHILLVEDDAAVRTATRLLLKSEGYVVSAAESLTDALERVREMTQVDLILTDYHLPDGASGLDVIAAIRAELANPLKAVLITGDTSSAVAELRRDPLLRVASKPIRAEDLLQILTELANAEVLSRA
jgi:two-component system, sensor histidine kinase